MDTRSADQLRSLCVCVCAWLVFIFLCVAEVSCLVVVVVVDVLFVSLISLQIALPIKESTWIEEKRRVEEQDIIYIDILWPISRRRAKYREDG